MLGSFQLVVLIDLLFIHIYSPYLCQRKLTIPFIEVILTALLVTVRLQVIIELLIVQNNYVKLCNISKA